MHLNRHQHQTESGRGSGRTTNRFGTASASHSLAAVLGIQSLGTNRRRRTSASVASPPKRRRRPSGWAATASAGPQPHTTGAGRNRRPHSVAINCRPLGINRHLLGINHRRSTAKWQATVINGLSEGRSCGAEDPRWRSVSGLPRGTRWACRPAASPSPSARDPPFCLRGHHFGAVRACPGPPPPTGL